MPAAEAQVCDTIRKIHEGAAIQEFYLPKVFVRVREPEQAVRIFNAVKDCQNILTGFIFPKYSADNAAQYNYALLEVNREAASKIWMMPILESADIAEPSTRRDVLGDIREHVDFVKDYVLNVRVGGNDFSNLFGVRRHYDETIYDIMAIAQLLGDIMSYFSRDYVVSGPVWEFFDSDNDEWEIGLRRELKLDRLNGFIGKTVIHPNQIAVVNDMLKVSRRDFEDARSVTNWNSEDLQVGKSSGGERMNEVPTHSNWAAKTMLLSEIYGIKD